MLNLPEPFLKRALGQFGNEYESFKTSLQAPPPVSIRLNPYKKINQADLMTVPWCTEGRYLPERPVFTADPLFHAGAYYVQEASSMFLAHVLNTIVDPGENIRILDACAAPGGKSTLINSIISDKSLLVANDVIRSRAGILEENLAKWGHTNFMVTSNDPKDFKKLEGFFDVIVVDAPCSGEGMFRKDNDAVNEWSENSIALCASRQQRIVNDLVEALNEGGYLIYSTCTFAPEENELNAGWICAELGLESIRIPVDESWGIVERTNEAFTYHFYPHKVAGEGLFLSCFRKKTDNEYGKRHPAAKPGKTDLLSKKLYAEIGHWFNGAETFEFITRKDQIYAVSKDQMNAFSLLNARLNLVYPGLCIGRLAADKLLPSHELALSMALNHQLPYIEVDRTAALTYLKKGDISGWPHLEQMENGWLWVSYEGHALGWIKKVGNRANNYYPKELRILRDFN